MLGSARNSRRIWEVDVPAVVPALILALLIGFVAGLRAMMPLAAVAWGAFLGWLAFENTALEWVGSWIAVAILSVLAIGELVTDQLPSTPSRKVPVQFGTRLVTGGLAGAAIGSVYGHWVSALGAGVVGAVLGTLGGAEGRSRLVAANGGKDLPVALAEDALAVILGFLAVYLVSVWG